jgi:hypothetical protein
MGSLLLLPWGLSGFGVLVYAALAKHSNKRTRGYTNGRVTSFALGIEPENFTIIRPDQELGGSSVQRTCCSPASRREMGGKYSPVGLHLHHAGLSALGEIGKSVIVKRRPDEARRFVWKGFFSRAPKLRGARNRRVARLSSQGFCRQFPSAANHICQSSRG